MRYVFWGASEPTLLVVLALGQVTDASGPHLWRELDSLRVERLQCLTQPIYEPGLPRVEAGHPSGHFLETFENELCVQVSEELHFFRLEVFRLGWREVMHSVGLPDEVKQGMRVLVVHFLSLI